MTVLIYKDFQASVTYEDAKLMIQVLHVDDTLLTECDSASQAQAAFEDLIEDYLETCAAVGKEPCKSFKGSFNVRVTPSLHRRAAMAAAAAEQTLNAWVSAALEQRLEKERAGHEILKNYSIAFQTWTELRAKSERGWANIIDWAPVDRVTDVTLQTRILQKAAQEVKPRLC